MTIAHRQPYRTMMLIALLFGAVVVAGCSPADNPLATIVLAEQVTAEDGSSEGSVIVDNIVVNGYLTNGQRGPITISCTAASSHGMVQSVAVDLSALGGPDQLMLWRRTNKWVWNGFITATVAGSAAVLFTATDDRSGTATGEAAITVQADMSSSDSTDPVPGGNTDPVPDGGTEPVPGGSTDPVPDGGTEPVPGGSTDPVPDGSTDPVPDDDTDPVPDGSGDLLAIDSIVVDSYLVQGEPRAMAISCTPRSPDGVVRSVAVDLSALGGPKQLMLNREGSRWVWSGLITATVAGSATLYFTATDDRSATATGEAVVTIDANTGRFDDTAYLAGLLNSNAKRVTIPRLDRPYFTRPLIIRGPKTITFEDGVVIEAIPKAFAGTSDCMLAAADQHDITILGNGATLRMRCAQYHKDLQWRQIISLKRCQNVLVQDLYLAGAGGDGIYVGTGCSDVTIRRVRCHANGRQGISVVSCNRLLIEECVLEGTFGNWPGAGIDFEPNAPDDKLLGCVVRDTVICNNNGYGFLVNVDMLNAGSTPVDITLDNCVIEQRAEEGPALTVFAKRTAPAGRLILRDTLIVGKEKLHLTSRFDVVRE